MLCAYDTLMIENERINDNPAGIPQKSKKVSTKLVKSLDIFVKCLTDSASTGTLRPTSTKNLFNQS